jgi:thiamine biosynthesis lipoprotein ApbE
MNQRQRVRAIRLASAAAAIGLSAACGGAGARAESAMLGVPDAACERAATLGEFAFAHEGVLGTSMELIVHASRAADAAECERRVLAEIERLRAILSTYDSESEIRRVMAGGAVESAELAEVLDAYALWSARTSGAIELNMAGVIDCWKGGEHPTEVELRRALSMPRAWNVDALGKGYIIDRAVAVGREIAPAGLLNIGGDIRAWGSAGWPVAIADPANPAENAQPLATFLLRDSAVATSGGYARFYSVGGQRYSHLIDPRTLAPAAEFDSATVVAGDCVTANALATAACVLGAGDGTRLAREYGVANWMIPRSPRGQVPVAAPQATAAATTAWPTDFQVSLDLSFKIPRGGKVKRPYLAVWVEDAKGKVVRTVTVWGKQEKYLREMTAWWQAAGAADPKLVRSVTRATREAGKYTITWDGLDDQGAALPKGAYTLVVEINREHGRHVGEKIKLACQDKKVETIMKATAESDESAVVYGPKAK